MAEPALPRFAAWTPRLVGLAAFAAYVWLAAPGPYWMDSQELGAAAVRLGIPHPTGFPLFCVTGRLAALLPIGELAVRLHWLSGACAALAVAQLARLVLDLAGEDGAGALAAALAALSLGAGLTFFRAATITEVYAPMALGLVVALRLTLALLRRPEARIGVALAFVVGLGGVGLHSSFRLLVGPLALVLLVVMWRRRVRWLRPAFALGVLGALGTLVYLPIRSATGRIAGVDWGHPSSLAALWDHVTAARIRAAFGDRMLGGATMADARMLAAQLEGDLGLVALVAAVLGIVWVWSRSRTFTVVLLAFLAADAAYAIFLNPMGLAERQNGVPFALVACTLAGVGIAGFARRVGGVQGGPFVAAALGVGIAVAPIAGGGPAKIAAALSDAPRDWGEAALALTPAGGIALVRSDSLAANLVWLGEVEAARPDVASLVRQHLWDRRRNRALLARIGASGDDPFAAGRPIRWELGDDRPPAPVGADVPLGALRGPPGDAAAAEARVSAIFAPGATADPPARREAARAWINVGVLHAVAGSSTRAAACAERAVALDPDSPLARANAALYRLQAGDEAAARAHAEAALAMDPERSTAWTVLGVIEARRGQFCRAVAAFDRALQANPGDPDAQQNRALAAPRCSSP